MSDTRNMVTLTIDGTEVKVPEGTPVLEAAKALGLEISHFCYHPGLEVVAQCRQCLVKIEGSPKLVPSCQAVATDGMKVETKDAQSTLARQQMLEFTLVNHPIDCPICDKAGECVLQRYYFEDDNRPSRVDVPKVRKPKVVDLGPHIVLDAERCILCSRCIRVCDEVAGVHQLEFHHRNDHQQLGTAPGEVLDNPYSINTVDVCPVGALTSKDYRFTMRAWELYSTPSVCNGCSTGCNVEVHHRGERVWRLIPRPNPSVNKYWMCDEGRFTYKELREERLAAPLVDGLPASWERAVEAAGERLLRAIEADKSRVGVVFSPHHTNEDNYVLARLAREIWGLERVYVGGRAPVPERADDVLRDADVTANRLGVKAILGDQAPAGKTVLEEDLRGDRLSALLVLGHHLPLAGDAMEKAAELGALVVIADQEQGIARRARVALPSAAWAEVSGTVTNRQGLVQRMHAALTPPGQAIPAWEALCRLGRQCGAAVAWDSARDVFEELRTRVKPLEGAEWGREARTIQLRWANSRG